MKDYFLFYIYRVFGKSYNEVSDPAFCLTLMMYFPTLVIPMTIAMALVRAYSILALLVYTFLIFRYIPRKIKPAFAKRLPLLKKKYQNRTRKDDLLGKIFIWIVVLIDLSIFLFSWLLPPLIFKLMGILLRY